MRWEPKWGPFPYGGRVIVDEVQRSVGGVYRYVPRPPQRPLASGEEAGMIMILVLSVAFVLSMVLLQTAS